MDKSKEITDLEKEIIYLNKSVLDRQNIIDAQATIGEWTRNTAWGKMTSKVYHVDTGLYEWLYKKALACLKAEEDKDLAIKNWERVNRRLTLKERILGRVIEAP